MDLLFQAPCGAKVLIRRVNNQNCFVWGILEALSAHVLVRFEKSKNSNFYMVLSQLLLNQNLIVLLKSKL